MAAPATATKTAIENEHENEHEHAHESRFTPRAHAAGHTMTRNGHAASSPTFQSIS
ncbi:hypothetical protein PAMC26510_12020 [Caballeronia sordidicola]|uniref:Uncharacterized protein n=1 Tax=Caballeronia sordidicola TaxID=196367 RepID=A0A242MXD2_CABSO|nr:hypothetical protein PAMC26510_12020 [Caballeronia sordidicola]